MPKFKIKSLIAFVILGFLIYAFRDSQGKMSDYLLVTPFIIIFWYLLGLQFALFNLRNVFFITLMFVGIILIFRIISPSGGAVPITGMLQKYDLNPATIARLKESHEFALELHFKSKPTGKDRYFKMGDLLYSEDGLHYEDKKQSLNLDKLPKTVAWIKANLSGNKLDRDVNRVKSWFVKTMTYTLSPGVLNSLTPLDQFLFDRREGFCEHFAASLSTILELKGYKSRVAFGYAGGSWNPIMKVLIFEDADAHAWVEVFDAKINQYKIIDPTSWIYPEIIMGRTAERDFSWIFLFGLVFLSLFGIIFIRKGSAVERFLLKVSNIEKKHGLDANGLTLSERVSRLSLLEGGLKERMNVSLLIYLKMYGQDGVIRELDRSLKRSLAAW